MKPALLIDQADARSMNATTRVTHRRRPWWRRLRQPHPWTLSIRRAATGGCELQLHHHSRGLIRRWQGGHARLLLNHPCLRGMLGSGASQGLAQHQVAQLLMAAASIELLLNRLSTAAVDGSVTHDTSRHHQHL